MKLNFSAIIIIVYTGVYVVVSDCCMFQALVQQLLKRQQKVFMYFLYVLCFSSCYL